MGKVTYPAIPTVRGQSADVKALIKGYQMLTGQLGPAGQAFNQSNFSGLSDGTVFNGGIGGGTLPGTGGGVVETPHAPQNVQATGLFEAIIISWDKPTFQGFAYAEIYRADSDDFSLATVVETIGSEHIVSTSDYVGYNQTKYYWVRFVNTDDGKGPIHATNGASASTSPNISQVIEDLSDEFNETHLAVSLRSRIDLIDTPTTGLVDQVTDIDAQWGVKTQVGDLVSGIGLYNDGSTTSFAVLADQFVVLSPNNSLNNPFFVEGNTTYIDTAMIKNASIQSAKIQSLDVGKIVGNTASFVNANISVVDVGIITGDVANFVTSNVGTLNGNTINSGFLNTPRINVNGSDVPTNSTFSVTSAGKLTAQNADIKGILSCTRGLGGMDVSDITPAPGNIVGGQTANVFKTLDTFVVAADPTGVRTLNIERLYFRYVASNNDTNADFRITATDSSGTSVIWTAETNDIDNETRHWYAYNVNVLLPQAADMDDHVTLRFQGTSNKFYSNHNIRLLGGDADGNDENNYYFHVYGRGGLQP